MKMYDYQLDKWEMDRKHLNYWDFWFTYDNVMFEQLGDSEFAYDNFRDLCKDIREDYKINRDLHKDKNIGEPLCYYFARYFEWNEKENCYEYIEYKLTFRKGRITGRAI